MSEVLTIPYSLAELPSAQHRAGLAGLVLMVRWLKRLGHNGVCEIPDENFTSHSIILRINREGLEALLTEVYAPKSIESRSEKIRERTVNKKKVPIEPLKTETNESGKSIYIYKDFIPKATLIEDFDRSQDKVWLKLWRDFIWALRKQPASRTIFKDDDEGEGKKSRLKTIQDAWEQLKGKKTSVELAGTNFLGSQAKNAEIVPFKDRGKCEFLLNFWVYAVQIYEPVYQDYKRKNKKSELKAAGYAIAIPDVANLKYFCDDFRELLRKRSSEPHFYFKSHPKQAVLDLAPAAGLAFLRVLRDQLAERARSLNDVILAVEVCLLAVSKDGKKNEIRELVRLPPRERQVNAFVRVKDNCWDTVFTAQRLRNILSNRDWYFGFDSLCSSLNTEQIFSSQSYFCRDAKKSFEIEVIDLNTKNESQQPPSLEKLIYDMVGSYIYKRLDDKYELVWKKIKGNPEKEDEYNKKKEKIIKEAFYGFRSRSGYDFVNCFALTMGSVQQSYILKESQSFEYLAKALYSDTDRVKSLTLLALSANSSSSKSQQETKEES